MTDTTLKEAASLALKRYKVMGDASNGFNVLRYAKMGLYVTRAELEAAVAKAVADEREACAGIASTIASEMFTNPLDRSYKGMSVAQAIRARGESE